MAILVPKRGVTQFAVNLPTCAATATPSGSLESTWKFGFMLLESSLLVDLPHDSCHSELIIIQRK